MDFCQIRTRTVPKEKNVVEIYPEFKICKSKDLMIRGKDFYAIWDEERGLWTTDSYDVQRLIDKDIEAKVDETRKICCGEECLHHVYEFCGRERPV